MKLKQLIEIGLTGDCAKVVVDGSKHVLHLLSLGALASHVVFGIQWVHQIKPHLWKI